jgi:pimeloyl-ACP methyl ester carboxylesterase
MSMHYIRRGAGKPLLLVHGIGGSWRSWQTILDELAISRDVIAIDLPGFGATPPLVGPVTISTLADAVTAFLQEHDLLGIDVVGNSMGGRLVLELARRGGVVGAVVSLDPGGFWQSWEITAFYYSILLSIRVVRAAQPVLPAVTGNAVTRSVLFAQFSAHPWRIPAKAAYDELYSFAHSPSYDELLTNLAYGEEQQPAPKGSIKAPLVIGWGRNDRVCFPHQSKVALYKFPDARLYWFEQCGHFPQWDQPAEAVRLILATTSGQEFSDDSIAQHTSEASHQKPVAKLALVAGIAAVVAGGLWLLVENNRKRA